MAGVSRNKLPLPPYAMVMEEEALQRMLEEQPDVTVLLADEDCPYDNLVMDCDEGKIVWIKEDKTMPPDMNHPEFSRRKLRFENSMARVPDDTEKTERCMTMFQACLIERFLKDGWRMIQEHKELNERKGQVSEQAFRRLKFKALVSQTVYERSAKEAVAYGKKWRARVVGSHERNDSTCCEPFASEYIETLSHLTHKFKEKVAECNAEYEFKMNVLMPVRLDRRRLDRSANI